MKLFPLWRKWSATHRHLQEHQQRQPHFTSQIVNELATSSKEETERERVERSSCRDGKLVMTFHISTLHQTTVPLQEPPLASGLSLHELHVYKVNIEPSRKPSGDCSFTIRQVHLPASKGNVLHNKASPLSENQCGLSCNLRGAWRRCRWWRPLPWN